VALTFDDGYANNLHVAAPLLEKYGMTATVFLSTRYIETGEWYPFVQLKLLRLLKPGIRLPDYKTTPIDEVRMAAAPHWLDATPRLTDEQRDTLRPLTVAEVRAACGGVLEFGAHSHSHCIARNESDERRREEVTVSVRKVAEWTARPARLFSYPNGERGDFGDIEKTALRKTGVDAAVTGVSGANVSDTDLLELKRYPLTVFHDGARFRAEASGVRSAIMSMMPARFQ
jgi:peptidoglycan/xylan/chitin deacetylase (PgdA/CDA1 family)